MRRLFGGGAERVREPLTSIDGKNDEDHEEDDDEVIVAPKKPDAQRTEIHGGCLPPEVHLMLTGSSRRNRELRGGDQDGYACSCVGGGSKWRGRLNWTGGRKAVAREACAWSCVHDLGREGVNVNPAFL